MLFNVKSLYSSLFCNLFVRLQQAERLLHCEVIGLALTTSNVEHFIVTKKFPYLHFKTMRQEIQGGQ